MTDLNRFLPALPVPEFAHPGQIVMEALPALAPREKLDVPSWAEKYRRIDTEGYTGKWSNQDVPYMVEPAQQLTSRRFKTVCFVGPARSVKSESLVLNCIGHRIHTRPRKMLVVAMTKDSAREFSIEKLDPLIRANRVLSERQVKGRGADNTYDKRFMGGMRINIGWPVPAQMAMKEIPDVLFTDYDRMPDDVGGEGAPHSLGRKRAQTFGMLGNVVVESSPSRPITRDDWKATTPHEAPPTGGILGIYNQGTRGRYYWQCRDCGEWFQPIFENLEWDPNGSIGERAASAEMACSECGALHPQDIKVELNRKGKWLHETDDGRLVSIDDDAVRDTDTVSYWCEGPVAALQDYRELVFRFLQAHEKLEQTDNEQDLKTTINVDQGRPYKPKVLSVVDQLSVDVLKSLSEPYEMEVLPQQVRFFVFSVDVQANKFVVQAVAYGEGLECWLVDRFDIAIPPDGAPGATDKRSIDPARYYEDWAALTELLNRRYKVADSDYEMLGRAMIIDLQGSAGVTENAYKFWRAAQKSGVGHRVFIVRGVGGLDKDRASYRQPEKVLQKRQAQRSDLRIVYAGTDKLKDEVTLSLTRKEAGPGKFHLPEDLDERYFEEFCAEVRLDDGWENQKSARNESLDLSVYAKALIIVIDGERIDWTAPPVWALKPSENSYAVLATTEQPEPVRPVISGRRVRSKGI